MAEATAPLPHENPFPLLRISAGDGCRARAAQRPEVCDNQPYLVVEERCGRHFCSRNASFDDPVYLRIGLLVERLHEIRCLLAPAIDPVTDGAAKSVKIHALRD